MCSQDAGIRTRVAATAASWATNELHTSLRYKIFGGSFGNEEAWRERTTRLLWRSLVPGVRISLVQYHTGTKNQRQSNKRRPKADTN